MGNLQQNLTNVSTSQYALYGAIVLAAMFAIPQTRPYAVLFLMVWAVGYFFLHYQQIRPSLGLQ